MAWGFYGRQDELALLTRILERERWAFVQIAGRRRIGKTSLIQEALKKVPERPSLYVQIPDAEVTGLLESVHGFLHAFGIDEPRPAGLGDLATRIGNWLEAGYVVVLDEFQFLQRKALRPLQSHLQSVVDRCASMGDRMRGCLVVLGSVHTEMAALLEDRRAPLYQRTTDRLDLGHMDPASLVDLLGHHGNPDADRLLFLWNLFEGVPKYYRDAYEQGVLDADRPELLRRLFFESSSPLRHEAEHWFLHELRGLYQSMLRFIAGHPGCTHADLTAWLRQDDPHQVKNAGGYLRVLEDQYGMVERRLPILAKARARSGRYYITDNFLRSWLHALAIPCAASRFQPMAPLIHQADSLLAASEGHALERLACLLYEERSRKGLPGFALTDRVKGYWDRSDLELDLVALDETSRTLRVVSCKRQARHLDAAHFRRYDTHVQRFLQAKPWLRDWTLERCALTVRHSRESSRAAHQAGWISEDLGQLLQGL